MATILLIYWYIKVSKYIKIVSHNNHTKHFYLEVNINMDWVDDKEIYKLTSAYITILEDCLIS